MFEYEDVDNEGIEPSDDETPEEATTKTDRRERDRQKRRLGPVRHLPGSYRPMKRPKGTVTYS